MRKRDQSKPHEQRHGRIPVGGRNAGEHEEENADTGASGRDRLQNFPEIEAHVVLLSSLTGLLM